MSAEILGADLLREVKEEGLDEVRANGFFPRDKNRFFDGMLITFGSCYAHCKSLRYLLRPDWVFRLSIASSTSSRTLPRLVSSNDITRNSASGPPSTRVLIQRRRSHCQS